MTAILLDEVEESWKLHMNEFELILGTCIKLRIEEMMVLELFQAQDGFAECER